MHQKNSRATRHPEYDPATSASRCHCPCRERCLPSSVARIRSLRIHSRGLPARRTTSLIRFVCSRPSIQKPVPKCYRISIGSISRLNGGKARRPLLRVTSPAMIALWPAFSGFEGGLTVTDINDFNGPAQTTNLGVRSSNLFGRATYQIFQQVKHFRCYRVVTVRACCFEYHKVKWK